MSKPEILSRPMTSIVPRYGLAVVSVAIALGLGLLAQAYAVPNVEFPLLLCAIVITIWYAGNGPGALALLVAVLSFQYFLWSPGTVSTSILLIALYLSSLFYSDS